MSFHSLLCDVTVMSLHSVDLYYDVIAYSSVCSTEKERVKVSVYGD